MHPYSRTRNSDADGALPEGPAAGSFAQTQHKAIGSGAEGSNTIGKLHRHLLPFFIAVACFCYLDRTALAFASLQLCQKEWFSNEVYGFGAGRVGCAVHLDTRNDLHGPMLFGVC